MGGCRCTYRNCSLRTDGKTHMFHYPVFDKVRCHQWLTNAHKLEFLNLKVSQLKNRVVCQHHFKDENFMNFKKDKLTFDAVPTEDGPFCDSSQFEDKKAEQDDTKVYSICLDDIENEYLTLIDKKANFSVKYGDFLTNCDLMDLDSLTQINHRTQTATREKSFEDSKNISLNDGIRKKLAVKDITRIHGIQSPNVLQKSEMQQVADDQNPTNLTFNVSLVPIEFDGKQLNNQYNQNEQNTDQSLDIKMMPDDNNQNSLGSNTINENRIELKPLNENSFSTRSCPKEKRKISIISEKKIFNSVPIIGKLEPVSPNRILSLPRRNKQLDLNQIEYIQDNPNCMTIDLKNTLENKLVFEAPRREPTNILTHEKKDEITPQKSKYNVGNNVQDDVAPRTSLLKNKITPERVAAIAEKRKFNMKLRDIIENCLDKLDEPDKSLYNTKKVNSPKSNNKAVQSKTHVGSYLAKEPELPNIHEYSITYLEARMKKMEDNLLNKIDQNSQKILELKQTFTPMCKKKAVSTQTSVSEDHHKKQLYQEISKYLSHEANSIIYEELFIDKYEYLAPKRSFANKRRKYR